MQLTKTFAALIPVAIATLASLPSQASAQGGLAALGPLVSGLSANCLGAFASFVTNPSDPLSQCLSLSDALTTFTSAGTNSSLVPGFQSYFDKDICGKPACTGQTLGTANNTLNQACTASDLAANNGTNAAVLFQALIGQYYTIRNAVCLNDTKTNTNCVVQTMNNVEKVSNRTLSLNSLLGLLSSSSSSSQEQLLMAVASNKTLLCTDCNKAILTSVYTSLGYSSQQIQGALAAAAAMANQTASSASSSSAAAASSSMPAGMNMGSGSSSNGTSAAASLTEIITGVNTQCGTTFLDGQIPSDVRNSSVDASNSSASGSGSNASTSSSGKNAAAKLNGGKTAAVGGAIALLAAGAALIA